VSEGIPDDIAFRSNGSQVGELSHGESDASRLVCQSLVPRLQLPKRRRGP
jgi:hypothetical protein